MPGGGLRRRTALVLGLRAAAICAAAPLVAACRRTSPPTGPVQANATAPSGQGPASLPARCTAVGVAGLVPGMTPGATSAFLEHNGLSSLQGYCFRGGGRDTVLVDPHWYPALIGLVPGTASTTLLPLDAALRAANFDPQFLQPPFQDVFVQGGRRFAVALGWRPLAIWANGRLLARLHLAPPPLAPTLAELLRYCARVRQALVGAGLYTDKARAAVQVLAQADLAALYPTLLAAFIQGYGGSVGRLPAPARAADLPGLRPLAALLGYAGGQHPWSDGSAVLTITARLPGRPAGDHVCYFPRLPRPVLPVQVFGVGCSARAAARVTGVGLLAAGLVRPAAQRALSVLAGLNPTAEALTDFAGWVPGSVQAPPLTRVPTGWNASWESGVFDDPIWDAALSTTWPQVAVSAEPRLIAAALAASVADGVRGSRARGCFYDRTGCLG